MKLRILLLTLFILVSGCIPASDSPKTATAPPAILPRLDPSPTPSGSTLPLTCQITDLNVYINEMAGYCIAYPSRFTLGDQPSDQPDIRGPAVDDSHEPIRAALTIEVEPAAIDQSLREQAESFLKEFSVIDPDTLTWSQVSIDGDTAWMVEPVPAMLAYRIVFVQHNGTVYRLLYWPVDIPEVQADLNDLTQTTLGSFAFTK